MDLLTILLDGDAPETLTKFRDAVLPKTEPLKLPKISPEVGEQIKRVAAQSTVAFQPVVDQLVTGHNVTDVDGEPTTGRVTFVDSDAVTVELPRYHERTGWHLGYASLDRTELRPSLPHEVNTFVYNLKLAKDEGVTEEKDANLLTHAPLCDTTPYVGKLNQGGLFVGLYVGTTDTGRVKLQRPVKDEAGLGNWGVRLEEVDAYTVSPANPAAAQELHDLIDQADREIHGVTE